MAFTVTMGYLGWRNPVDDDLTSENSAACFLRMPMGKRFKSLFGIYSPH